MDGRDRRAAIGLKGLMRRHESETPSRLRGLQDSIPKLLFDSEAIIRYPGSAILLRVDLSVDPPYDAKVFRLMSRSDKWFVRGVLEEDCPGGRTHRRGCAYSQYRLNSLGRVGDR